MGVGQRALSLSLVMSVQASRMLRRLSSSKDAAQTFNIAVSINSGGKRAGSLYVRPHQQYRRLLSSTAPLSHCPGTRRPLPFNRARQPLLQTSTGTLPVSSANSRYFTSAVHPKNQGEQEEDSDYDSDHEAVGGGNGGSDGENGVGGLGVEKGASTIRPPGVPASGKGQTVGGSWAAMQYDGRDGRKVKYKALEALLKQVDSREKLKYAEFALKLYKKNEIPLRRSTAMLFVQTCCGLGDPMTAVRALSDKGMGFYRTKVVPPDTFNYLLTQLYMNGSIENVQFAIAEANVNLQPLDMRSKEIFRKVRAFNKKKNLEANRAEKAAATADADAVAEAPTTEGAAEVADSEAESTEGSVVSEDETADESGADKQSGDGVAEGAGKDVSEDGDRR